jgi:N-acetylmuramoyl-L-alanine amidase
MNTVAEIKAFQRKHGLVPDGIIGPQTRRVMKALATPPSKLARKEPDKAAMKAPAPVGVSMSVRLAEKKIGTARLIEIDKSISALPLSTARVINEVIVHCAATPEGKYFDRRDIDAWHKQRGWPTGIGYHAVVLLDGTVQAGRPIGQEGIHTAKHNRGTVGVCYIGGLTSDSRKAKDTRTPEQVVSLHRLCQRLKQSLKISKPISGHNQYAQKACPSFDVTKDELGQL